MKNKLISTILASSMIITSLVIGSIAVSSADAKPTLSISNETGKPGDIVNVKINVSNSPEITNITYLVNYDNPGELSLENATDEKLFPGFNYLSSALDMVPFSQNFEVSTENVSANGVLSILSFKIPENAPIGEVYNISFVDGSLEIFNTTFETFDFVCEAGSITVSVDYSELNTKIAEAKTVLTTAEVSENGTDVPHNTDWVTSADVDALEKAISDAEAMIKGNTATSLADVTNAISSLENAIKIFNEAKQDGKKLETVSTLQNIELNRGKLRPDFSSDVSDYKVSVANTVSRITVTATATNAWTKAISINGEQLGTSDGTLIGNTSVSLDVRLKVGRNIITIVVTAEDDTQSTYTITITRANEEEEEESSGGDGGGDSGSGDSGSGSSGDSSDGSGDSTTGESSGEGGSTETEGTKPENSSENVSNDGSISTEAIKEELNAIIEEIKNLTETEPGRETATSITLRTRNAVSITPETIRELAAIARESGKKVVLNADTMSANGRSVQGRLYVDPELLENLEEDIKLGIFTDEEKTAPTKNFFEKWFQNEIAVIKCEQQGTFGARLRIAAKVDLSNLDIDNLVFYSYDAATNKYVKLTNVDYRIDSNGYIHFFTERAGDIIISNGDLEKR